MRTMLECVPNVSEGRDDGVIEQLVAACGKSLVDTHFDEDHHRSVFTLAGPGERGCEGAVRMLARAVAEHIDIRAHDGVHPRLGALDVVPFVALGTSAEEHDAALDAAHSFARWWSMTHDVPCFMYDLASPNGTSLPMIRKHAFKKIAPDYGPTIPHGRLGATAISVRKPLVAINCVLVNSDLRLANRIAHRIRESSGGLPGVRALAFRLPRGNLVQVSMNLVDLDATGVEAAVMKVRELARKEETDVGSVELVGLMPSVEYKRLDPDFCAWANLHRSDTIEARVGQRFGGTVEE